MAWIYAAKDKVDCSNSDVARFDMPKVEGKVIIGLANEVGFMQ